jgi:hypothetical protein
VLPLSSVFLTTFSKGHSFELDDSPLPPLFPLEPGLATLAARLFLVPLLPDRARLPSLADLLAPAEFPLAALPDVLADLCVPPPPFADAAARALFPDFFFDDFFALLLTEALLFWECAPSEKLVAVKVSEIRKTRHKSKPKPPLQKPRNSPLPKALFAQMVIITLPIGYMIQQSKEYFNRKTGPCPPRGRFFELLF